MGTTRGRPGWARHALVGAASIMVLVLASAGVPSAGAATRDETIDAAGDVLTIPPARHGERPAGAAALVPAGPTATIDVLVVFTKGAAARAGGVAAVRARIAGAVAQADAAFVASGVPARVALVGTAELRSGDGLPAGDALRMLQSRDDGAFDEVHDLRRIVRADVVTMWADVAAGSCGMAYLMGPENLEPRTADYAFSVVDDAPRCYRAGAAFAHELGHLLGAQHDRTHAAGPAVLPYAYGLQWIDSTGSTGSRTLMAYDEGCGNPCSLVPLYTTPDRFHEGRPVGTADHDNVRAFTHTAPLVASYAEWLAADEVAAIAVGASGTYTATGSGKVVARGDAPRLGDLRTTRLRSPIVGMAADPDGHGYWLVAADGGVFAFDAPFAGSAGGLPLTSPVVGMAADPDGHGYWLVAADGGVFAFDAPFAGSAGGLPLTSPVVGMAADPDGHGYWLVAADGGVFAFDAPFAGSAGGLPLTAPVVGMAADPDGHGYWLVAADGGVFAFGAPFAGSRSDGAGRVAAIGATPDGYVLAVTRGLLSGYYADRSS